MDKFNLREYLKHNPLLEKRKDYYFTTPRFIDPPGKMVSIQSVFDKILSGEWKGEEANGGEGKVGLRDFTVGKGSMFLNDKNVLYLRQFGRGGGDFGDEILGTFSNGEFIQSETQPHTKTGLRIYNYLGQL